ncbi:MAG: T9SS type A sorting domain-containing protein [Bacteroidetes bacterium]|nr:T9SS type A sorting domain-containing protein [Bacteroidota bacterium]
MKTSSIHQPRYAAFRTIISLALLLFLCAAPLPAQISWEQIPGPSGLGSMKFVVASDDARAIIYCGLDLGGIYRSLDSGRTWQAANSGLPRLSIGGLHVNRRGDLIAGVAGGGFWRSADAGLHWSELNAGIDPGDPAGASAAFAEDTAGRIYSTAGRWIYRYSDSAATWQRIVHPITGYATSGITLDSGGALYIGTDVSGMMRALPNNTWQPIDSGLGQNLDIYALLTDRHGRIVCGTKSGIFRLDTSAWYWQPIDNGMGATVPEVRTLQFLPDGSMVAGTSAGVYRSFDEGDSWSLANPTGPTRILHVALNATLLSDVHGFSRATFSDTVWRRSYEGMQTYTFPALIRTASGNLYTKLFSTWMALSQHGERMDTLKATDGARILGQIYALRDGRALAFVGDSLWFRSDDGGSTWAHVGSKPGRPLVGMSELPDGSIVNVAASPTSQFEISRSRDLGASWKIIGRESAIDNPLAFITVGTNHVIVSGANGIYHFSASGDTLIRDAFTPMKSMVMLFAVAPNGTLFAGETANSIGDACGLFRSLDTGRTWERVSGGLRDTNIHALLVDGTMLYIGTGDGVYRGRVNDTVWTRADDGITGTSVRCLVHAADGLIYAGTDERGLFRTTEPVAGVATNVPHAEDGTWISASPNPARSVVSVNVSLRKTGSVHVAAYTIDGRWVEDVYNGIMEPTEGTIAWHVDNLPNGLYLLKLTAGTHDETIRVVVHR